MYKLGPSFEELTENIENFTRKFQILKKNVTGNHNLFRSGQFVYSLRLYASLFFDKIFKKLIIIREELFLTQEMYKLRLILEELTENMQYLPKNFKF